MSDRFNAIGAWLDSLGYRHYELSIASEDASFRRYFRLRTADASHIVMDAPPDKEPCDAFVRVAGQLRDAGLNAPRILHEDHQQGFLLLTDFGNASYLDVLNPDTVDKLYADALDAIQRMQAGVDASHLPAYDEALLRREMSLFRDWFLQQLLKLDLSEQQAADWRETTDALVNNALQQPQVFVHRDYHSRNLMHLAQDNPGIIDFQDAVKGPVTYDLVSLLRDCYISWPQDDIRRWVAGFHRAAQPALVKGVGVDQFLGWFDLMGAQRHLKAVGIFSRLCLRDGKDKFLCDIPRTLGYLESVAPRHAELQGLHRLLGQLDVTRAMQRLLQ
jgi:hypothetical protein